jgi:hypothetical protein
MLAAVIAVCGGDALKTPDLPDGLFNDDLKLR